MYGMAQVVCGYYACAGLKIDGSIVSWGFNAYGVDTQVKDVSDMTQVACAKYACVRLKTDETIIAWGSSA